MRTTAFEQRHLLVFMYPWKFLRLYLCWTSFQTPKSHITYASCFSVFGQNPTETLCQFESYLQSPMQLPVCLQKLTAEKSVYQIQANMLICATPLHYATAKILQKHALYTFALQTISRFHQPILTGMNSKTSFLVKTVNCKITPQNFQILAVHRQLLISKTAAFSLLLLRHKSQSSSTDMVTDCTHIREQQVWRGERDPFAQFSKFQSQDPNKQGHRRA